jgi:hypothetical protein
VTPVQRGAWFDFGVRAMSRVVGVVLYVVFYALGGWALIFGIVAIFGYAVLAVAGWLHTWSDQQGHK